MEFTQYTCPVCSKRFVNGDDVVVCPECGAPHHRECYEENGHCFYEDKHSEGFSFEDAQRGDGEEQTGSGDADVIICPNCKAENERTNFYCGSCGFPLDEKDRQQETYSNPNQNPRNDQGYQGIPFGFGAAGMPTFDPLAGMKSEEEIADGVTVGEAAKYVGKSTNYYLPIFKRLKVAKNGRFCFSAFLFSGSYFLYRKMYALGIIITLLMIGSTIGSTCIILSNSWLNEMGSFEMMQRVSSGDFPTERYMAVMLYGLISLAQIAIRVLCGVFANKLYYGHCVRVITETKSEEAPSDVNKVLEEKGGVNLPMAVSFFAAYLVIMELCQFYLISH